MSQSDQNYESMLLCPWGQAGELAFHEAIQDGWEPLLSWWCEKDIQHIALRREVKCDLSGQWVSGKG